MGRRKLEMKRIEDKSSRLVSFSKRRAGLIKKARQLSILCDVDAAVFVFSSRGKLYEFCSGGANSVDHILSRYQKSCLEAEERTIQGAGKDLTSSDAPNLSLVQEFSLQHTRFRTCKELLETVDRLVEENNAEKLSVIDMTQPEEELNAALVQTRSRKTQLIMEHVSTLQEKERKLIEEKEEMEKWVVLAKQNGAAAGDSGVGGLNDLATNQINLPQLVTLPLFNG